jgi:hypothetical protein
MANLIPEEGRFADPNDVNSQIREYVKLKASENAMKARAEELRATIFERMEEAGYEDDKGNIQLDLEEAVDGVVRLEKQRRAARKLNEPKAEEILKELGIFDDVFVMKPVLEEDLLMAAYFENKITEEQLDEMFPTTVTWALRTLKK